ncbi:MAG: hypothetical protein AB7S81_04265, partial [Bdellovibrionales bacterium]
DRVLYCASTVSDACVRACLEYIPSEKLFGTLVEKTLFRVASQRLCQKMLPYNMSLIGTGSSLSSEDGVKASQEKAAERNLQVALRINPLFARQIQDGFSEKQKSAAPDLMKDVELVLSRKLLNPEVPVQALLDYRRSLFWERLTNSYC